MGRSSRSTADFSATDLEAHVETFVFSHQRGSYLANFLRSVRDCDWPGSVTIVDDGSTEQRTVAVLAAAERDGHTVIRRPRTAGGAWGGLQASMAQALDLAEGPLTLFAQDDLQLVRALRPGEEEQLVALVSDPARSPFVFPAFHMESWKASRNLRNFAFDPELGMPIRTLFHPLPGVSEVSLLSPERVREAGWDPSFEERGGSVLAYRLFGPMTSYAYPFLAFLPYPSVPRRGLRYAVRHPKRLPTPTILATMDAVEVEQLFARDPSTIPFATQYLRPVSRVRARLIGATYWEH
jgi:glycosyltransferase involved in cell wall biosynthesis